MLGQLKRFQAKRRQCADDRLVEDTFSDAFGRPNQRQIKAWSDRELHDRLIGLELHPVEHSMAQRELRRREAWDAPAGQAYRVAIAALIVSVVSLVVAIAQ